MVHSGKSTRDTAISRDVPQYTVTNTWIDLCLNFLIIKLRERRYRLGQNCLWADTWGLRPPKIWMKPCPEYYDVRTELELIPATTLERSSIISLTSSANYSSHQRHLWSQPKGSVRGTDWVINGREDTELILASRVGENCLLSIWHQCCSPGDKRIQKE